MKYRGFMSYSHSDSAVVGRLHRWLESYRPPGAFGLPHQRRRLAPIFLDREELPTSADLGSQLTQALESSEYLLVFCSPAAARSRWVNEEVASFVSRGLANKIIAILIDGSPSSSSPPTDETIALPPALQSVWSSASFPSAPSSVDLRSDRVRQRAERLRVVSLMTDLDLGELQRHDMRRGMRRTALLGVCSIAVAACLMVLGIRATRAAAQAARETASADSARLAAKAAEHAARVAELEALAQERKAREQTAFFASMFAVNGSPAEVRNVLFADLLEKACHRLLPIDGTAPEIVDAAGRAKILACFAVALAQLGRAQLADSAAKAVVENDELFTAVDLPREAVLHAAAKTATNVGDYARALRHLDRLQSLRAVGAAPPDTEDLKIAVDAAYAATRAGLPTAEVDELLSRAAEIIRQLGNQLPDAAPVHFHRVASIVAKERHRDAGSAERHLRQAIALTEKPGFAGGDLAWAEIVESLLTLRPEAPDAVRLAKAMTARYDASLGRRHPSATRARLVLGAVLNSAGRFDDAIAVLRECASDASKHGPDGRRTARHAARLLAAAHLGNGQWQEALRVTHGLMDEAAREPAPDEDELANILELHATSLMHARDFQEATSVATRALDIRRKRFGTDAPETCPALFAVSRIRSASGDVAGAIEPLCRLVSILDATQPPPPVPLVEAHTALAYAFEALEQPDQARAHANRAVAICDHDGVGGAPQACALLAQARLAVDPDKRHTLGLATLAAAVRAAGPVGSQPTPVQTEMLRALCAECVESGIAGLLAIELGDSVADDDMLRSAETSLDELARVGYSGADLAREARLALAEQAADAARAAVATDHAIATRLSAAAEMWLEKVFTRRNAREQAAYETAILARAQSDVLAGRAAEASERLDALREKQGPLPRAIAVVHAISLGVAGRDEVAAEMLREQGLLTVDEWPQWAQDASAVLAADKGTEAVIERLKKPFAQKDRR
jgi:tetratricopeptide (TPR) repeat protein